jgi:hypothetical protein
MQLMRQRAVLVCLVSMAVGLLASGCDWYGFANLSTHAADNPEDTVTPASVSTLTSKFTLSIGAKANGPIAVGAVVNGVLYAASSDITIGSGTGQTPTLYAFSANGTTRCGGTPITCSPLWTASLAGSNWQGFFKPAVTNGVVYVNGGLGLEAFDAAGRTKCSGTPKVCHPLWQASVNWDNSTYGTPTVLNGVVFVTSSGNLEAFDANGTTNCSGSPKVCSSLWTAPVSADASVVTVAGGIAYLPSSTGGTFGSIVALDANGKTGCSGTPTVCTPLWEYPLPEPLNNADSASNNYVSVSGTTLYVGTLEIVSMRPPQIQGSLEAFDAGGTSNCTGTPKVCTPEWTSPDNFPTGNPAVVGDGFAFWAPGVANVGNFAAFYANGCSNTECNPVWRASIAADPVAVGGSVLFASDSTNVYAFDAGGSAGCAGSVCSPLWSTNRPAGSIMIQNAVVANGTLYVSTQHASSTVGEVLAYGLP